MAIFHQHQGYVSRSTGRSAVQAAAYIAGERYVDERKGIVADYTRRAGDVYVSWVVAPDHAPEWIKNPEKLWNHVELYEDFLADQRYKTDKTRQKHKDTLRTAQTIILALPKEFSYAEGREVVDRYIEAVFTSRGLVAHAAIHTDDGNPHAHLMITRRAFEKDQTFSLLTDRDITTVSAVRSNRETWADVVNNFAQERGYDQVRIDHRSFKDMGLDMEPTVKAGWYADRIEARGGESRIKLENAEIFERNKERILADITIAIKEALGDQTTFTETKMHTILAKRLGGDEALMSACYERILDQCISVGQDAHGRSRYTTKDYMSKESEMFEAASSLRKTAFSVKLEEGTIQTALQGKFSYLLEDQQIAVRGLCDDSRLSILIGRAGAGKTTALKAVAHLYKEAGTQVIGMALSSSATSNLKEEAAIDGATIAFHLDKWNRYEALRTANLTRLLNLEEMRAVQYLHRYELKPKSVIIVDEAGMVGVETMNDILRHAQRFGAKVILVGDDVQLKALSRGDAFRGIACSSLALAESVHKGAGKGFGSQGIMPTASEFAAGKRNAVVVLDQIRRQKKPWMQEASRAFSDLDVPKALAAYENHGRLTATVGFEEISYLVAKNYLEHLGENQIVLAATNRDCARLNMAIRSALQDANKLPSEQYLIDGQFFSVGDKIVFNKVDRRKHITLKTEGQWSPDINSINNGEQGIIKAITPIRALVPGSLRMGNYFSLEVELIPRDEKNRMCAAPLTIATFNTRNYTDFTHGYAQTIYKSQGKTYEYVQGILSRYMDVHETYVMGTRHEVDLQLYYDQESIPSFKSLCLTLSKLPYKDLNSDFYEGRSDQTHAQTVFYYQSLKLDMVRAVRAKDFEHYRECKEEFVSTGQAMLRDYESHKSFLDEAGISRPMLEYTCGIKERPLSRFERDLKTTVTEYAELSQDVRALYQEIRSNQDAWLLGDKEGSDTQATLRRIYETMKADRNELAHKIFEHKAHSKEFVTSSNLKYGMKVIEQQAKEHDILLKTEEKFGKLTEAQHAAYGVYTSYIETRNKTAALCALKEKQIDLLSKGTGDATGKENNIDVGLTALKIKETIDKRNELASQVLDQRIALESALKMLDISILKHGMDAIEKQANMHQAIVQAQERLQSLSEPEKALYTVYTSFIAERNRTASLYALKERQIEALAKEGQGATTSDELALTMIQIKETVQKRNELAYQMVEQKALFEPIFTKLDLNVNWDKVESCGRQACSRLHRGSNASLLDINAVCKTAVRRTDGKTARTHHAQYHTYNIDQIGTLLLDHAEHLAQIVYGSTKIRRTSREIRVGNSGSVRICLQGENVGTYYDHETSEGGGMIHLFAKAYGLSYAKAIPEAARFVGGMDTTLIEKRLSAASKKALQKSDDWSRLPCAPSSLRDPSLQDKYLSKAFEGYKETMRFTYRNEKGQVVGHVLRLEDENGRKVTPPLTPWQHKKGFVAWRFKGFGDENRTLYNLDQLVKNPNKPVLVVEGEKAASLGGDKLKDYVIVSWSNGANAVCKTDWKPILGRDVVLWPDHDEVGKKCMDRLAQHLESLSKEEGIETKLRYVNVPENFPAGWDIADSLPEGHKLEDLHKLIPSAEQSKILQGKMPITQEIVELIQTVPTLPTRPSFNGEAIQGEGSEQRAQEMVEKVLRKEKLSEDIFTKAYSSICECMHLEGRMPSAEQVKQQILVTKEMDGELEKELAHPKIPIGNSVPAFLAFKEEKELFVKVYEVLTHQYIDNHDKPARGPAAVKVYQEAKQLTQQHLEHRQELENTMINQKTMSSDEIKIFLHQVSYEMLNTGEKPNMNTLQQIRDKTAVLIKTHQDDLSKDQHDKHLTLHALKATVVMTSSQSIDHQNLERLKDQTQQQMQQVLHTNRSRGIDR